MPLHKLRRAAAGLSSSPTRYDSVASLWQGATGSFTFDDVNHDITGDSSSKAIETVAALTGDFVFVATHVGSVGGTRGNFGFFEDGETFNENLADGGMESMTESFWFQNSGGTITLEHGGTNVHTPSVGDGTVCKFERVGSTIKFYEDDVLEHTFSSTLSTAVRLCFGRGGLSARLDDVYWEN